MIELRATYRLQLTPDFGFAAARSLVPYLRDLGISHLYLSPSLQARAGSTHGYDVVDPGRLSTELGGAEEFRALCTSARQADMGVILDVVPNHMAADDGNRFWAQEKLRRQFFDLDPLSGRHRRFFDLDELAGLRQEDPEVFEQTHACVLELMREGLLDGVRVDHPDGLADPPGYLGQLRSEGVERLWVEKILSPQEHLREDWPVSGTVGYEFLNDVCALFVDPAGERPLTSLWESVSGDRRSFGEVAFEAKLEQVRTTFAPEVQRLLRVSDGAVEREPLERALASLPVYRTYVDPVSGRVADEDRRALAGIDPDIRSLLLLERPGPNEFVTRFQQTTPAVTAKGVEDTAFYRYGRLLALNEVGGDPARFGIGAEQFHSGCLERAGRFPLGLLTTMTHDAKRSGDVRARIGTLASIAAEWREQVERWFQMTEPLRSDGAPDDAERYFILQTMVGAHPISAPRLEGYVEKALREAKRNTAWVDGSAEWEEAVKRFCRSLLQSREFSSQFEPFAARVAELGDRIALRQLVLKMTAPGVPDTYQGDELYQHVLVDPDNRRPIDWGWHQAMLRRLMGGSPPDAHTRKLFVTLRLLGLRARLPEVLGGGAYEPLAADPSLCAFVRGGRVLAMVRVREGSGEHVELPGGRWRDVLQGEERSFPRRVDASRVLGEHGLAVFEKLEG